MPLGVAESLLSLRLLPETYGAAARLDLPGVALVTKPASLAWSGGWPGPARRAEDSAEVIAALAHAARPLLAGFFGWEARAAEPMPCRCPAAPHPDVRGRDGDRVPR